MCAECRSTPCLSGCPNRVDKSIGVCPLCNEKILDYEPFYDFDSEKYHESCFQDSAVSILMDMGARFYECSEE